MTSHNAYARRRTGFARKLLAACAAAACLASMPQDLLAQKRNPSLTFGQEAPPPTLDPHFSTSIATRNVAMHIFEQLVTRDENNAVIPELAEEMAGQPRRSHLHVQDPHRRQVPQRQAIDVGRRQGLVRALPAHGAGQGDPRAGGVDGGARTRPPSSSTVDKPQPVFLDELSAFVVPIAIIPAEQADREGGKLEMIGTGPFAVRRVGARQPHPAEALRRLQARHALQGHRRLRRQQAGLVRHRRLQDGQGAGRAGGRPGVGTAPDHRGPAGGVGQAPG